MNEEKYLELFKKYYKHDININGIILVPKTINKDKELTFEIVNNDDISFSKVSLNYLLLNYITTFNKVLSIDEVTIPTILCEKIHIGEKIKDQIHNILKNKDRIIKDELTLIINHVKFEYELFNPYSNYYNHELLIKNFVKPIGAYITDSGETIDLEDAFNKHRTSFRYDRLIDSDNYYEIDNLISDYNTLIDYDFMTNYTITEFI